MSQQTSSIVEQKDITAAGDVVAGNKISMTLHRPGVVEQLLEKLKHEIETNSNTRHTIEDLQRFHRPRARDGIAGLEAKLKAGNREEELYDAMEKKELFVKLLERWSLYSSAQEIFAYLLAKAEYEFTTFIHPEIENISQKSVDQMIKAKIVEPTIEECGATVFSMNHGTAMGMLYWLAEQCFVRWHK